MPSTTSLFCRCGAVHLEISGAPILAAECCCNSCRRAGDLIEALPGAPPFRTALHTTPYVLQRKDRVRFVSGSEHFREFHLTPASPTRRVVAICCNTPLFTEFKHGHWLSLYASLWPEPSRPRMTLRTMVGDLPDASALPADMPNMKAQSGAFFVKLLAAWIAMGFRVPKVETSGPLRLSD